MSELIAKQVTKNMAKQAKRKVTKNFEKVKQKAKDSAGLIKEEKKIKGRKSVLKKEDKPDTVKKYTSNLRSIQIWNDKLENMLIVLEADEQTKSDKPLDKFQGQFTSVRNLEQDYHDLVNERKALFLASGHDHKDIVLLKQKIEAKKKECRKGVHELEKQLTKKKDVFKDEELRQYSESLSRLKDNIRLVGELFEDQNKQIGRAMRGVKDDSYTPAEDIENQGIIKMQGATAGNLLIKDDGLNSARALRDDNEDPERKMTEFERQAIVQMRKNDEEIDEAIGKIDEQLGRLKLHAEDINVEVNLQAKRIKQVHSNVLRARDNLDKRNSDMTNLLKNYREVNSCCKDFGLFLCLLILIGCNIAVLKWKGTI